MRVVLVTFGGRKPTLEILFGYVIKYKHYIDEYKIFIATENMDDIEYMENFAKQFEKAKIIYTVDEFGISISDKNRIWDNAYKQCQKEDEVYIKLDDDIVYFDETLFTIFLEYRMNNPDIPLLFPAIINNIYTSWLFEKRGIFTPSTKYEKSIIGEKWNKIYNGIKNTIQLANAKQKLLKIGELVKTEDILCPNAWGNLNYCAKLHKQFINDLSQNTIEKYKLGILDIDNCNLVSISCCSWLGATLKKITLSIGEVYDDEIWWCIWMPTWLNLKNVIFGNCIVSHYAYYKQRELGLDDTDILNKYLHILQSRI